MKKIKYETYSKKKYIYEMVFLISDLARHEVLSPQKGAKQ